MSHPLFRCPAVLGGLTALLAACGGGDSTRRASVETVDSAGIVVVTSSAPAWAPGEGWSLSSEPTLSIGVAQGDDAYQLFRVADAMRLPDGRIVVTNAGTRDTRLYEADGTHVRTLGGRGDGPEEYRIPTTLLPRSDGGFTVVDFMDRVHYDARGEFLGRDVFDRRRWTDLTAPLGPTEGAQPLPDGTVLSPVYGQGSSGRNPRVGPPFRPDITVIHADPATGAVDTLARIGGILQQYVDVGRERPTPMVGPFSPSGRWGAGRDGTILVWDGALPQVERIEPDGTHRILRWTGEAEPVTAAEIEAWKERQRGASWVGDRLPELERGWAAMDMPETKAWVSDVRPSADGSTWVRLGARDEEGPAEWRIFGPDGAWLGSLALPPGFRPTDIGAGWVLGVHVEPDTEIETVRMYAVEKR